MRNVVPDVMGVSSFGLHEPYSMITEQMWSVNVITPVSCLCSVYSVNVLFTADLKLMCNSCPAQCPAKLP